MRSAVADTVAPAVTWASTGSSAAAVGRESSAAEGATMVPVATAAATTSDHRPRRDDSVGSGCEAGQVESFMGEAQRDANEGRPGDSVARPGWIGARDGSHPALTSTG